MEHVKNIISRIFASRKAGKDSGESNDGTCGNEARWTLDTATGELRISGTGRLHDFVNGKKIGCIGASYGGFMTQYLQTKTDLFAAAISHAGISDHTSYWGEACRPASPPSGCKPSPTASRFPQCACPKA